MTVAREGIKYQREKTKTKTNVSVNNLEKKQGGHSEQTLTGIYVCLGIIRQGILKK